MPFRDINTIQSWEALGSPYNLIRRTGVGFKYLYSEVLNSDFPNGYQFDQNKNYQFITSISMMPGGNTIPSIEMKLSNPFSSQVLCNTKALNTTYSINFYTYAVPNSTDTNKILIIYGANNTFTQSGISKSKMNDIDFIINGYREFSYGYDFYSISQPSGWLFTGNENDTNALEPFRYEWLYNPGAISPSFSTFGVSNPISTNYLAKLIDYDTFNLNFEYETDLESTNGIDIYIAKSNRLNTKSQWIKVMSVTQSGIYEKIAIPGKTDGIRNYLLITASQSTISQFKCSLSSIYIYGGYHPSNNRQFLTSNDNIFNDNTDIEVDIEFASYLFNLNQNGITFSLNSKLGNGLFKSGVWENGVWNNGWRDDTKAVDFDDVEYSILTKSDVSWKIKIRGSVNALINSGNYNFDAGNKVTIGNIVAIDINDNRKLLKDQYTIEEVGIESLNNGLQQSYVIVNLDTTFPYRRIERDSPNHKIKITKNIWLSGAFFNGYFSGVWNNGLFKGYPLITEMFDTHWIDGFFNGGHFESHYPEFTFYIIEPRDFCAAGYTNITLLSEPQHKIKVGDYIFLEFFNIQEFINAGGVNNYDGLIRVLSINGNVITINRLFSSITGLSDRDIGLGTIKRYTSTGLIQNFKFYDNNRSNIKSNESNISSTIFSYDSWIDVNYDNSRSVTIGRDFKAYEPLTGRSINRNNLFGYPTYDVLSSASRFRDSNTLDIKLYKLGTKYKVFTDFIGEFSEFNEPFNPDIDFSNFFLGGWTYSYENFNNIKFNRTESLISVNDINAQSYIDSGVTGDELYVFASASGGVLNNTNININKNRYSVVEFDIITYSVSNYEYTFENLDVFSSTNLLINSPFTFNDLNSGNNSISKCITPFNNNLDISSNYYFDSGFDFQSNPFTTAISNLSDGSLIIGGYQNKFNSYTQSSKYITKILPNGSIDTLFDNNIGNILTGVPSRIIVDNSNNIYIVAYTTYQRVLKINSLGIIDNSFNLNFGSSIITDIALDPTNNNILYVIGSFATFSYGISNTLASKNKIAKIVNGSNDNTFNSGGSGFPLASDRPFTIAVDEFGSIYVGGNILRYSNTSNNIAGIVKLTSLGVKDSTFLPFINDGLQPSGNLLSPTVIKIIYESGNLYIGGNFTSYNKANVLTNVNRLIKLNSLNGNLDLSFNIGSGFNTPVSNIAVIGTNLAVVVKTIGASYKGNLIKNGFLLIDKNNANVLATTDNTFTSTINLSPYSSIISDLIVIDSEIICVGSMESYQGGLKEITSDYNIFSSLGNSGELKSIDVTINITNTDVSKLIINLKSPNGDIINLKDINNGSGDSMINTVFSTIDSYNIISISTPPYTNIYKMDKILDVGSTVRSNVTEINNIDIQGIWQLYILDSNQLSSTRLNGWSINFKYDLFDENIINNEPLAKFPLINFSNLNYEISSQRSGDDIVQVYKKMNYLPVSNNINHLLTTNTFRLDSIEKSTPEEWGGVGSNLQTKKFEYFYNKTDLMMNISGSGFKGLSQSTVIIDNLKMYEVDMIPFFKYFNDVNIYKGVQIPYSAIAPEIDYLDNDFIFIDNISVGLDTIDNNIILSDVICTNDIIDINDFSISLSDIILDGTASGTQPYIVSAILTSSQEMGNYIINWSLIGNTTTYPLGFNNSGNTASVNLNSLINNTSYILYVGITYSGIFHSSSCNIIVGDYNNIITLPTIPQEPFLSQSKPIIVTWNITSESNLNNLNSKIFPGIIGNVKIFKNSDINQNLITPIISINNTTIVPKIFTGNSNNLIAGDSIYVTSFINSKFRFKPSTIITIYKVNLLDEKIIEIVYNNTIYGDINNSVTLNTYFNNPVILENNYRYDIYVYSKNEYY